MQPPDEDEEEGEEEEDVGLTPPLFLDFPADLVLVVELEECLVVAL